MEQITIRRVTEWIYEAARIEAAASKRRIVPELWGDRDDAFRDQMVVYVTGLAERPNHLPTPEEAHESWVQSHEKMGWSYGLVRDPTTKIHPDMVPFEELPKDERDKDEVFLELVKLAFRFILPVLLTPGEGENDDA